MDPAELAAARAFRAARRAALEAISADLTVSVFIRHDRHDCARKGGKSVFLELKEHYAFSPVYVVADGVATEQDDPEVLAAISRDSGAQFVSSGRFGWIWTQGRCPACGLTARSAAGRLVDPQIRPPAEHAIIS